MEHFKIKCADIVIDIKCRYSYTKERCAAYLSDEESADITVCESDIDYDFASDIMKDSRPEFIEFTAVLNALIIKLFSFNAFILHSSAVSVGGVGVLFSAPSGTGKTTHTRLLKKVYGDKVYVVNGDKPLITYRNDKFFMSGTPWCGKEMISQNTTVPLDVVCFVERSDKNSIEKIDAKTAIKKLFSQVTLPKDDVESVQKYLVILNEMFSKVKFCVLKCNMQESAAIVSYNYLTLLKNKG